MANNRPKRMACSTCGSTDVRRNADCAWSEELQQWEVVALFDDATCEACGGECSIEERDIPDDE